MNFTVYLALDSLKTRIWRFGAKLLRIVPRLENNLKIDNWYTAIQKVLNQF